MLLGMDISSCTYGVETMIGLLVCGHGNFATGMRSSLQLIAGEQKQVPIRRFSSG